MALSTFFALVLSSIVLVARAQDCGLVGQDEYEITAFPTLETTAEGYSLWRHDTFNVERATGGSHAHFQFINGLRYPTVYEYQASATFANFLIEQRAPAVLRNVTFYCIDGGIKQHTFIFPVIDVNNQEPVLNAPESIDVTLPLDTAQPINDAGSIVVSDSDFEVDNASLEVQVSNSNMRAEAVPQWTGDYPSVYGYDVNLYFENEPEAGTYNVAVTVSDGNFAKVATVTINVA